jgi:hypothetical protein
MTEPTNAITYFFLIFSKMTQIGPLKHVLAFKVAYRIFCFPPNYSSTIIMVKDRVKQRQANRSIKKWRLRVTSV